MFTIWQCLIGKSAGGYHHCGTALTLNRMQTNERNSLIALVTVWLYEFLAKNLS